ncbi:MAG: hypothetical protein DRJ42_16880 [Deltaproteobacteria bacterium]|nr:MAG: hypothetical protein DRJ42_16880 [Deltaproteobacteria bacterium]
MTVQPLTVVASLAFLLSLWPDINYFFAPSVATQLGDVTEVVPATLTPNTFVRIEGTPMASGTVRYTRMVSGSMYAVFPLAGQRNIFVQIPIDGPETERSLSQREFSGRLVTFGELGSRFGQVRKYLGSTMDMPVSSESFLLLSDETPTSYYWALFLAGLALLFVLVNVWLMFRWFRPLVPAVDLD